MQSLDVTQYPNVEELYLASDILITDYSSSMFDYGVLRKPIILYLPDYEKYSETRGMYFNIQNKPPGSLAYNEEELINCLNNEEFDSPNSKVRLGQFHEEFCSFDHGNATENIINEIFKLDF